MAQTVKVSSKGQVVIPVEIRRQLGIDKHTRLEILVDGETVVLKVVRAEDWRSHRGALAEGQSLTKALEEEHRAELRRDKSRYEDP